MATRETANFATIGQVKELISSLAQAVPQDLTAEDAQYWIEHKSRLGRKLSLLLRGRECGNVVKLTGLEACVEKWHDFWSEFGVDLDFSNLRVPLEKFAGCNRLLVMAEGVTTYRLYELCHRHFPCHTDFNDKFDIFVSDRNPATSSYAVWVRDYVEADYENVNISANGFAGISHTGITFPERLLFELKYFLETGKHLDVENQTLCVGSRHPSGAVPVVYWSGGVLCVRLRSPLDQNDNLRPRSCFAL